MISHSGHFTITVLISCMIHCDGQPLWSFLWSLLWSLAVSKLLISHTDYCYGHLGGTFLIFAFCGQFLVWFCGQANLMEAFSLLRFCLLRWLALCEVDKTQPAPPGTLAWGVPLRIAAVPLTLPPFSPTRGSLLSTDHSLTPARVCASVETLCYSRYGDPEPPQMLWIICTQEEWAKPLSNNSFSGRYECSRQERKSDPCKGWVVNLSTRTHFLFDWCQMLFREAWHHTLTTVHTSAVDLKYFFKRYKISGILWSTTVIQVGRLSQQDLKLQASLSYRTRLSQKKNYNKHTHTYTHTNTQDCISVFLLWPFTELSNNEPCSFTGNKGRGLNSVRESKFIIGRSLLWEKDLCIQHWVRSLWYSIYLQLRNPSAKHWMKSWFYIISLAPFGSRLSGLGWVEAHWWYIYLVATTRWLDRKSKTFTLSTPKQCGNWGIEDTGGTRLCTSVLNGWFSTCYGAHLSPLVSG
jgi:hypothetical protein